MNLKTRDRKIYALVPLSQAKNSRCTFSNSIPVWLPLFVPSSLLSQISGLPEVVINLFKGVGAAFSGSESGSGSSASSKFPTTVHEPIPNPADGPCAGQDGQEKADCTLAVLSQLDPATQAIVDATVTSAAECEAGGPTMWCKDAATMKLCKMTPVLCAMADGIAPPSAGGEAGAPPAATTPAAATSPPNAKFEQEARRALNPAGVKAGTK